MTSQNSKVKAGLFELIRLMPRNVVWRLVGLFLQVAVVVVTMYSMAASGEMVSSWRHLFVGLSLSGGFILWKEAEKVGQPKPLCITQDDIDADADVAEAVDVITEYVKRREANIAGQGRPERSEGRSL